MTRTREENEEGIGRRHKGDKLRRRMRMKRRRTTRLRRRMTPRNEDDNEEG